jgi:hypothetical protein
VATAAPQAVGTMVPAARHVGRFCRGKTERRTGDTIARNGHAQEVTEMGGFKLTGMSEVTRNLEELKKALDGVVAKVSFDPLNSQDVERAIREVEQKVDFKMAPYVSTPGVPEIAAGLKMEYRKALLQKGEEARRKSPA